MKKIKLVWDCLVKSSANAQKISLTVKGFLTLIIPAVLVVTQMFNLNVGNDQLSIVIDYTADLIVMVGGIIGGFATVFGLVRKIIFTFTGNNQVVAVYKNK